MPCLDSRILQRRRQALCTKLNVWPFMRKIQKCAYQRTIHTRLAISQGFGFVGICESMWCAWCLTQSWRLPVHPGKGLKSLFDMFAFMADFQWLIVGLKLMHTLQEFKWTSWPRSSLQGDAKSSFQNGLHNAVQILFIYCKQNIVNMSQQEPFVIWQFE